MRDWLKSLKNLIAPSIVALVVAGVAHAAVYQWSPTAATNATADATINWSEGMSPSSVNDSARAMMARIANWRDDFSGVLATGGTATAFTVTTNQGFTSTPTNGQLVSVTFHTTNGIAPTLAADGGTAFPIQTAAGTAVSIGVLTSGSPYDLKFNSSASAWILKGFYSNPFNIPLGGVIDYTGTTAPNSNFVLANGQCISRTTYAAYFSLVSTTFGACDGLTTFAVPDLSNRIVAGTQMGGVSRISVAGGNFDGATLGTAGGLENHTLTVAQLPIHTPAGTISSISPASAINAFTPAGSVSGSVGIIDPTHGHQVHYSTANMAAGVNPVVATINVGQPVGGNSDAIGTGISASLSASFSGNSVTLTGSSITPTFTGSSIGSGAFYGQMPPAMVLTKVVRIL